jgi:hypothetical protein
VRVCRSRVLFVALVACRLAALGRGELSRLFGLGAQPARVTRRPGGGHLLVGPGYFFLSARYGIGQGRRLAAQLRLTLQLITVSGGWIGHWSLLADGLGWRSAATPEPGPHAYRLRPVSPRRHLRARAYRDEEVCRGGQGSG